MDLELKIKECRERHKAIVSELNAMEKHKQELIQKSLIITGEISAYKKIQEEESPKSEIRSPRMATIPDEQLEQLVNDVTEIKVMLKGYNGYPGLCADHEELKHMFFKFRNYSVVVFVFLLGSGALGVGIWKLLSLGGL